MRSRLRLLFLLPLATLIACGASSGSPFSTTSGGFAPVTGDYVLTVSPGTAATGTFAGALAVSGTSVTGVFQYNNVGINCVSSGQDIPFTGSIANNVLTLTSAAFSNSIATVTIQQFSENNVGATLASGTIAIAGGTCALASSPLQTAMVPSFAGQWTGPLSGPTTGTVTVSVTEASANADGQFPVTTSVAFSGNGCNLNIAGVTGLIRGYNLSAGFGANPPNSQIGLSLNSTGVPASLSLTVTGVNGCLSGTYTGSVTD